MAAEPTRTDWTFLHAADLHLDTPMTGRDETLRRELRSALRTAFERLIELALEENVRAVLLAGDIADGHRLSLATEDLMVERFRQLGQAGIPVFLSPGNHDYVRTGSPMHRVRWPENVTVFQSINPESKPLLDADGRHLATIHGVGHTSPKQTENLVERIRGEAESVLQIGLVHTNVGQVDLSRRHENYAPSTLADFSDRNIDYWAIGHIHGYRELSDRPWVIYPGCMMGRDIGETGAKGCVLVRVRGREDLQPEFRPLAPVTFHLLEIDVAEMENSHQFFDAVRARWLETPAQGRGDEGQVVRVIAQGRGPLSRIFRAELSQPDGLHEFEDRLERTLGATEAEFKDQTAPPLDMEGIGDEVSVRGQFTQMARNLIRDPHEREAFIQKISWAHPGWSNFNDAERTEYVRDVLRTALVEGVERLTAEDAEPTGS